MLIIVTRTAFCCIKNKGNLNGRVYLELVVRGFGFDLCIRSIKEIFQRAVETGSVLSLQPLCMLHISKMGRKKKQ